jgi:sugar phosphate isomerase/epimerase
MKILFFTMFLMGTFSAFAQKKNSTWEYLSTANGKVPLAWTTTEQTGAMAVDLDKDGVNDFVVTCRVVAPSILWYRRNDKGWKVYTICSDFLTVEAGGAYADIDGDGDLDLVYGGDWQTNEVWWFENPYPNFDPNVQWKRHVIKNSGKTMHHDQAIGDFKQNGKLQVVTWNQFSKSLIIADIPPNPKTDKWNLETIFSGEAGEKKSWYAEGCTKSDVDGDGYVDLIAGNYWFKYRDGKFIPIRFAEEGGRVVCGKFKSGKTMQIVVSPGDGDGRLLFYECVGNPQNPADWKASDLIGREIIHGHTLEAADINGDGNLDLFCAEMAKWSEKETKSDNPKSEAMILYGDGLGNFNKNIFKTGWDFHEGRVADLDGDGDMDILCKPYNWKAPRIDIWLQNGTGKKLANVGDFMKKKVGLEIYSLRNDLEKDTRGTLKYIKKLGFTEIELPGGYYNLTRKQFMGECDQLGLKPTSMLSGFETFRDSIDKIIADAKYFHIKAVGCGWIPHNGNGFTREDADMAIKVFNKAGERLAREGITLFYHCHGYEFKPSPEGTLFDYIVEKTDAKNVKFEMDVYWAFYGGAVPELLLKKYPTRFIALHIKDMKIGQETGEYSGITPLTSDVAVGTGQLDFQKILRAAMQIGIKNYFIEDESPDVKNHLPISLKYLKSLK